MLMCKAFYQGFHLVHTSLGSSVLTMNLHVFKYVAPRQAVVCEEDNTLQSVEEISSSSSYTPTHSQLKQVQYLLQLSLPDFLPKEGQRQSSDCLPHTSDIPHIPAADLELRSRCSPTDKTVSLPADTQTLFHCITGGSGPEPTVCNI